MIFLSTNYVKYHINLNKNDFIRKLITSTFSPHHRKVQGNERLEGKKREINKERVGPIPRGNRINYIPKIKYIKYSTSGFFQLRRKTILSNSKSLCVLCIVSVRLLQIQK